MTKRPNSLRHLDDAIRRTCAGSPEEFIKTRTLMANAIVAQMLPDGVVKGGSAIKMRFGDTVTRFTTDLDTATTMLLIFMLSSLMKHSQRDGRALLGESLHENLPNLKMSHLNTLCALSMSSCLIVESLGARSL